MRGPAARCGARPRIVRLYARRDKRQAHVQSRAAPCAGLNITYSPFYLQYLQAQQDELNVPPSPTAFRLLDQYPTVDAFRLDFCASPYQARCFSGSPFDPNGPLPPAPPPPPYVPPPPTSSAPPLPDICFDRVDDQDYLGMLPHPDGSNRVFLHTRTGYIFLAQVPSEGSGKKFANRTMFLDLHLRTIVNGERGLLGFALHPNYLVNGRFFVSYICNGTQYPDCQGPCECNAVNQCSIPQPNVSDFLQPLCEANTIVAEYSAGHSPRTATVAINTEVRRLLTFSRPYANHNGGHLLFRRTVLQPYMYYMSGDGGGAGDIFNFAQRGTTFLGKILRLDVDNYTASSPYGIPSDNPFVGVPGIRPEIYALGLRNPWSCTFDRDNDDFICADVGQNMVEEVDVIEAGGNYGWRMFEGTLNFTTVANYDQHAPPGGFTDPSNIFGVLKWPKQAYTHQDPHVRVTSVAIIGGPIYRSPRVPCYSGKYIFNDQFGAAWIATDTSAPGQPRWTTMAKQFVNFYAALNTTTPIPFNHTPGNPLWFPSIHTWGEDYNGDPYMLTPVGVYKVVGHDQYATAIGDELGGLQLDIALAHVEAMRAHAGVD
eukprot:SM000210S06734  [mRNA]  locus=s210:15905:20176:+ [translate_table: standard]